MPEIVQDIGAYAGLASVVGLAVLSALYFSQARDVKRLREWAGRAPERAEHGAAPVPGRVAAQPQQKAPARPGVPGGPGPAVPAGPGGPRPAAPSVPGAPRPAAPAPVAAGAAAAKPAAATAAGARPVTATAQGPATPGDAPARESAASADEPGSGTATATDTPTDSPASAPGAAANSRGGTQAPPRPGAPPVPPGRPPVRPGGPARSASQPTAIIPPPRRDPWYRRLAARPLHVVLAVAGVLIVGGAAAFGVTQLVGDDEGGGAVQGDRQVARGGSDGGEDRQRRGRAGGAVNPKNVTVAVLNGTTVPGLAATIMDQAEEEGFRAGTVANFLPNQQLGESVVQYTPGHERDAAAVSRRLGVAQREAVNPSSQELAGDATVVVLVGADMAP